MRSLTVSFSISISLIRLLLVAPLSARAQQYTITDLGTLAGADMSNGLSVNSSAEVVGCGGAIGYSCPSSLSMPGGFEWSQATGMRALPPLVGYNLSSPFAINDSGQIVGWSSHTANGATPFRATIWFNGTARDLGVLFRSCGDSCSTYSFAISSNGLATGCSVVPPALDGNTHAFLWNESRGMLDLGTLDYYSSCGVGVNQSGAVAGWLNDIGFATIGFFWTPADGMQQIYPLPGADYWSPASAINNLNQVVGQTAWVGGYFNNFHAYLWSKGKGMTDLGILGTGTESSQAMAINDSTQIVGYSGSSAFIWSAGLGMQDLNTLIEPNSGWILNSANAITNNGLIAGSGTINGETHAFLLEPNQ